MESEFGSFQPGLPGRERLERFYQLPEDEQRAYWETLRKRIDRERDAKLERSRPKRDELPEDIHERLLTVGAAAYVHAIAGVEVEVGKRICCPLPDHDDNSRDFRVYEDNGWRCFGCNRGGDIYNFAGALWNLSSSGKQFKELQQRLYEMRLVA